MKTDLIKKPVITEKSLALANERNVYTFQVAATANKNQVKAAIETVFGVTVIDINTIRKHQVKKTTGRKRVPVLSGYTKKALVTLKKGDTIDVFDIGGAS